MSTDLSTVTSIPLNSGIVNPFLYISASEVTVPSYCAAVISLCTVEVASSVFLEPHAASEATIVAASIRLTNFFFINNPHFLILSSPIL